VNKKFIILPVGILILISAIFTIQNFSESDEPDLNLTGTPADNFSEEQRSKFCGTGDAKSNDYVTEYKIPTDCTLPQAIVIDYDGNIWFVESNTGNLAKFNPVLESFEEFENPLWPKGKHSMMWGIDYAPDGTIWFTDEKHNSVWKFNVEDQEYSSLSFPSADSSSPQRLELQGSKLIINDFKGNRIVFSDYIQSFERLNSYSIPSNNPDSVTADFTIDGDNIWFTRWLVDGVGTLTKINQTEFDLLIQNDEVNLPAESYILPMTLNTPNGITADNAGNIWIADSSSSLFFKFNPNNQNFTQYVTSNPQKSTYGNYTGEIKSPTSKPYWIDMDSFGKLVFNEPGSNRIGVFDPETESLVEYFVPSQNPHWGDCADAQNCGISQVFDFVIVDNKIWFTEWAENNLGVVDRTVPLPFEIQLDENKISLLPGESKNLDFTLLASSNNLHSPASLILLDSSEFLDVQTNMIFDGDSFSDSQTITMTLSSDIQIVPGEYKVLLGAETEQVSVSKFVTVIIE
jgi:virginiamycin B lyase